MKWLAFVGVALAAVSLGVWATYRDSGNMPIHGRDPIAFRAEPLARPVLRLEGLTGTKQVGTSSQAAVRVPLSELVAPNMVSEAEEPL